MGNFENTKKSGNLFTYIVKKLWWRAHRHFDKQLVCNSGTVEVVLNDEKWANWRMQHIVKFDSDWCKIKGGCFNLDSWVFCRFHTEKELIFGGGWGSKKVMILSRLWNCFNINFKRRVGIFSNSHSENGKTFFWIMKRNEQKVRVNTHWTLYPRKFWVCFTVRAFTLVDSSKKLLKGFLWQNLLKYEQDWGNRKREKECDLIVLMICWKN